MAVAAERKRQSLLRTELQWLARGARARSTKQKAHIDRIRAMQEQAGIQAEASLQMSSISTRMGRTTIELDQISKSFGDRCLIRDYTYIFLKNDRIGIVGPNGCGKSTLLKIITGSLAPDSGTVTIGQTIRIGYFSQESEEMDGSLTAIEYIREVGEYVRTSDGRITASQMLERFLFDGAMQWSKIEKLSGGEKRRLYLLRVLMSEPNVLILDEPTNDLDIQTLEILEEYLDAFDGIVITVSHDRYFLDRIARRIFAFEGNGQIRQYEGGYSDYLNARPQNTADALPSAGTTGTSGAASEKSASKEPEVASDGKTADSRSTWGGVRKLKFTYKEQKEYETIDTDIAALENRIEELEAAMLRAASDYGKLNQIVKDKEAAEALLDEKMERWIYLNELKEKIDAQ
jgi:ATP-binding cassette subfamily F protein uup